MINLSTEKLIPVSEAARIFPSDCGERRHPSTVIRWALNGIIGPNGDRVKLEHVRIGRGWFTSVEAMHRFSEALTGEMVAA
jgi:hypothetical protein